MQDLIETVLRVVEAASSAQRRARGRQDAPGTLHEVHDVGEVLSVSMARSPAEAPMAGKTRQSRRELLALVGGALLTGALSALGAQAVAWLLDHLHLFS